MVSLESLRMHTTCVNEEKKKRKKKHSQVIATLTKSIPFLHSVLQGLILNSGVIDFERIDQNESMEKWKEVFDTNFFSLVSILKHSLVHLRKSKGRVIFVSSTASVQGVSS